ncbi:MAG: sigma-54-dependent Fis family transcriptional regulator [Planctomycetota bacterium]
MSLMPSPGNPSPPEFWLETLATTVEQPSEGAATRRLLEAIVGAGLAEAAALMRATPPDWQTLAVWPKATRPPIDLAAEACDAETTSTAGDWSAAVLVESGAAPPDGRSSPREVLLLRGAGTAAIEAIAPSCAWVLGIGRHARAATRNAERLRSILDMTKSWRRTSDLRSLLEQMAEAACQLFAADRASIFLWDQAAKTLVGRPALGVDGGELRIPDDAGVVGAVLQSRQPVRVSPTNQEAIDRATDKKTGYQTDTLLGVPLVDRAGDDPDGQLLGVFELLNKRHGDFTEADERGLADLADYAAVALAETQEFEQLLERHEQMVDEAASGVRLLGECSAIEALRATVDRVADTDLAILILGENGCGKEVVAQSLHYKSGRRQGPFVAVNCAAIAESLLESELFGHEKGAFTDARESRAGKFELAAGGTLLLDEIGDMSLGGQAKLLRVLEEKTVVRVGGGVPIETDVRVLAATNADLASLVREKRFREDLYFRLNVVSIDLPPLRRRGDDVMLLAGHFLDGFCRAMGRKTPKFTTAARKRMLAHAWPGNVRELRNLMERVAYLSPGDRIEADDLAFTLSPAGQRGDLLEPGLALNDATHLFQEKYIRATIDQARGNVSQAAKQLGVHRSNLYRKMRALGMSTEEDEGDPA